MTCIGNDDDQGQISGTFTEVKARRRRLVYLDRCATVNYRAIAVTYGRYNSGVESLNGAKSGVT